jgi:hypothetical protein
MTRDDVEEFFTEQKANTYADCKPSRHETLEKSHGRIETRTVTAVGAINWLKERHAWVGLTSIVMVESRREIGAKSEFETRFYISSLFASYLNVKTKLVSEWERGEKRPSGPSLKLLSIVKVKGLLAIA